MPRTNKQPRLTREQERAVDAFMWSRPDGFPYTTPGDRFHKPMLALEAKGFFQSLTIGKKVYWTLTAPGREAFKMKKDPP